MAKHAIIVGHENKKSEENKYSIHYLFLLSLLERLGYLVINLLL